MTAGTSGYLYTSTKFNRSDVKGLVIIRGYWRFKYKFAILKETLNSKDHGRHSMLFVLSALPIPVLHTLDTEANKFYDSSHQWYDTAVLTMCYTQQALRLYIDSEIS